MIPPKVKLDIKNTHRLIPSRYPTKGIFDDLTSPSHLKYIFDLETWTNDRITTQYGKLYNIPQDEWIYNKPNASVIMASFCHPSPTGGRFNNSDLGAWYSAMLLKTAFKETIYHRTKEILEFKKLKGTVLQIREYLSDFLEEFHDVRQWANSDSIYNLNDYRSSQELSTTLKSIGSHGIVYNSVRHIGGECIACYKPKSILNVRQGDHFELRWVDETEPEVVKLSIGLDLN